MQFSLTGQWVSNRHRRQKLNVLDLQNFWKFSFTWGSLKSDVLLASMTNLWLIKMNNESHLEEYDNDLRRWSSMWWREHLHGESKIFVHLKQDLTSLMSWIIARWSQMLHILANWPQGEKSKFMNFSDIDGKCSEAAGWWIHNHEGDYRSFDGLPSSKIGWYYYQPSYYIIFIEEFAHWCVTWNMTHRWNPT